MSEWLPIETAPSGDVLLYFPRVQLNNNPAMFHREMIMVARVADYGEGQSGPTHWQPLPDPPSKKPAKEDHDWEDHCGDLNCDICSPRF